MYYLLTICEFAQVHSLLLRGLRLWDSDLDASVWLPLSVISITIIIVKPRPKSQSPKAQPQPSQTQSKSVLRGLGLTLKSYGPPTHPPHPPHPQLLSMKEASNKKTQRVKVTLDDPLYLFR